MGYPHRADGLAGATNAMLARRCCSPPNAGTLPTAIPLITFWEGARGEASPVAAHREQPHAGRTAGRVAPGCTPSGA
jgi:hypothetical protein